MAADRYSEVMVRLRARDGNNKFEAEATVDGAGFWTGGEIDFSKVPDEQAKPADYGQQLWSIMSAGWPDLTTIFANARGPENRGVRLRLLLDTDTKAALLHKLRWEFLVPKDEHEPVGINPATPVSRFLALRNPAKIDPHAGLSVLLAISNPADLKEPLTAIDVNAEVKSLLDALTPGIREGQIKISVLAGRSGLNASLTNQINELKGEILPGAASADNIAKYLKGKDVLHLIAHGNFRGENPLLFLEKDDGTLTLPGPDFVAKWAGAEPRLIFLQSCRSDADTTDWPAAGLGPRFVEAGVLAVVAMRDFVAMDAARQFSAAFYQSLLVDGEVDVAANAGRRATFNVKNGDWAIPVLYSRLRAGERIWNPDPLRSSIRALKAELEKLPEVKAPFPVEVSVVKNVAVVPRELDFPTSDACLDARSTTRAVLAGSSQLARLTLIVGGRGRAKSSFLRELFVNLVNEPLQTYTPLLVKLCDIGGGADPRVAILNAWRERLGDNQIDAPAISIEQLGNSALCLLVDGDEDPGSQKQQNSISILKRFLQTAKNCRAVLSIDQSGFDPGFFDPEATTALLLKDLRPQTLRSYLENHPALKGNHVLLNQLIGPFSDLAGIPWILSRILQFAEYQSEVIESRFQLIDRLVNEMLAQMPIPGGRYVASCALQEIAWRLQGSRGRHLSIDETYSFLIGARGARDFHLDSFRTNLIEAKILAAGSSDSVRFAYAAAHDYFTAGYLNKLDRDQLSESLRGIVSGVRSLDRLRKWQNVLLLLSGQMEKPDTLLQMLLDVGFGEGEHLLLAARCVHEARCARKHVSPQTLSLLTDSLIWWSSPRNGLSARSRRRAVRALGYLLTDPSTSDNDATTPGSYSHQEYQDEIVEHLFELALKPVRRDGRDKDGRDKQVLDYSGIRLEAMSLLFQHHERSLAHLRSAQSKQPPEILQFVTEWLKQGADSLCRYLEDPALSDSHNPAHGAKALSAGMAAFALISSGETDAIKKQFLQPPVDDDLHWLMADGLVSLRSPDAINLVTEAVKQNEPSVARYVIYAIGKLGSAIADKSVFEYLRAHLKSSDLILQGLSLRACAEVLDTTRCDDRDKGDKETEWVRDACHKILRNQYTQVPCLFESAAGSRLRPENYDVLKGYAIDALQQIGDDKSLKVLRNFCLRPSGDQSPPQPLQKLAWEAAEYIRLRNIEAKPKTLDH